MSDYVEFGDSGIVPLEEGWAEDVKHGYRISPDGIVYDKHGEVIDHPTDEEEYRDEDREEDWRYDF